MSKFKAPDYVRLSRLAQDLQTAQRELEREAYESFPKSSKTVRSALAIERALMALKCELDSRSCDDLPEEAWSPDLFYGSYEGKEAARIRVAEYMAEARRWAGEREEDE